MPNLAKPLFLIVFLFIYSGPAEGGNSNQYFVGKRILLIDDDLIILDAVAAKLAWMKQHLPLPASALGESKYVWKGKVPWDATKLAFKLVQ